jgi:hypothetical protein
MLELGTRGPCLDESTQVSVVSIATGIYLEYWKELAVSIDSFLFQKSDLTLVLLTDQPKEASKFVDSLSRVNVSIGEIPPLGWPEATLLRYALIEEHWGLLSGDLIVYLDADMRVARDTGTELAPKDWIGGIGLVPHPGFSRGSKPWLLRLKHPRLLGSDLKLVLNREHGLGQWERYPGSKAFVAPKLRRQYVCGGVWMGERFAIKNMISTLAQNTQSDLRVEHVARWHDESHLNWWAAHFEYESLSFEYCFDESKRNFLGLNPRIIAVDKKIRVRS